jgi:hypothetical protein
MSSAAPAGTAEMTSATSAPAKQQERLARFVIFRKKDEDISTVPPGEKKANPAATLPERDDWVNFARAFGMVRAAFFELGFFVKIFLIREQK